MPDEEPPRTRTLADRAWPALPLALVVLAALVAVVGVVAAPEPTSKERIGTTVEAFARAVQERRGEDACRRLTPAAREAAAARVGTLGCAETIRSFDIGLDAAALRAARLTAVRVTGERATIPPGGLGAPGGRPLGRTITLERSLGIWRIAST